MNALPVCRASELEIRPEDRRWLIEGLWADEAVGILGGEPKCCKSFLALDLAVAVAAGVPALRHFPPARTGPVLLFAAEDALHVVRRRLEGIALAAGADFDALEVHVITTPVVRLDLRDDRHKLRETVERLRPTLLVLDPFVRMHRVDENTAADVAPILAWLRELQRKLHTAVLVVHHSRKGAAHARAGQALRGSSELHAWGDSNLYVRRRGQQLLLTVEHRAAPSDDDLAIELSADGDALALELVTNPDTTLNDKRKQTAVERVEQVLIDAGEALSLHAIRKASRMRTSRVSDSLVALQAEGRVVRSPLGYQLAHTP
jgi:hypothetical protein